MKCFKKAQIFKSPFCSKILNPKKLYLSTPKTRKVPIANKKYSFSSNLFLQLLLQIKRSKILWVLNSLHNCAQDAVTELKPTTLKTFKFSFKQDARSFKLKHKVRGKKKNFFHHFFQHLAIPWVSSQKRKSRLNIEFLSNQFFKKIVPFKIFVFDFWK